MLCTDAACDLSQQHKDLLCTEMARWVAAQAFVLSVIVGLLSRGTHQYSLCSAESATNGVHEEQPSAEAEPAPSSGSSSPEKDQQAQADLAALHASHRELKATHGQLQTELQKAQQQLAQAEAKEAEQASSATEKATAAADKAQQELQAAEDKSAKLSREITELREQSKGAEEQLGTLAACMRGL